MLCNLGLFIIQDHGVICRQLCIINLSQFRLGVIPIATLYWYSEQLPSLAIYNSSTVTA